VCERFTSLHFNVAFCQNQQFATQAALMAAPVKDSAASGEIDLQSSGSISLGQPDAVRVQPDRYKTALRRKKEESLIDRTGSQFSGVHF
jgi:hypothetical protein